MSRSKNLYQGANLGRVQRSEYDDSKLRDLARHDARLGESLKTVERAKNVMKKSMEADRQLFMKAGSPVTTRTTFPSQGSPARLGGKTTSQTSKLNTDTKFKRYSVIERPNINDLDQSIPIRRKSFPRPSSFHEQNSDLTNEFPRTRKDVEQVSEKPLEQVQGNAATNPGASDRLREHEVGQTSTNQRGINSVNRSTVSTTKYGKSAAKSEPSTPTENGLRQKDSNIGLIDEANSKSAEQFVDENGDVKFNRQLEETSSQELENKIGKRSTIWETLSTPKHTSMTRSKRSQIEQEFTTSHIKTSKSSPAILSTTRVKGHGKPPLLPGTVSFEGRQLDVVKNKITASGKARNDE